MEITAKELRGKPGQIIEQASHGTEIIITMRGKRMAKLIPYKAERTKKNDGEKEDIIFGLWADQESVQSVEEYVRAKRKGRKF